MDIDGLMTVRSSHGVRETMDRLEADVRAHGLTVFARIDHAAGAEEAGLALRPTELLIFGNAKAGTPIMLAAPTAALDLPLKALIWEDSSGAVWVSYNAPEYLQQRHNFPEDLLANIAGIRGLIEAAVRK